MRKNGTRRSVFTVAWGVVATVLAGLFALSVNLGIMRAAGTPSGPGRIDSMSVERPLSQPSPGASPTHDHPRHGGSHDSDDGASGTPEHELGFDDDD